MIWWQRGWISQMQWYKYNRVESPYVETFVVPVARKSSIPEEAPLLSH